MNMAEIYEKAGNMDAATLMYERTLKKYKYSKKVWSAYQLFRLRQGDGAGAKALLARLKEQSEPMPAEPGVSTYWRAVKLAAERPVVRNTDGQTAGDDVSRACRDYWLPIRDRLAAEFKRMSDDISAL